MIEPTFDTKTNIITIPKVDRVVYYVNEEPVSGQITITDETVVTAKPIPPSHFRKGTVTEWTYKPTKSSKKSKNDSNSEDENN